MKNMTDLGHKMGGDVPSTGKGKSETYYPSVRLPSEAIGDSPTDGKDFTLMVKCRVRSIDNKDKACDVELRAACPANGYDADDDEPVAKSAPKRSFMGSMKKVAKDYPTGDED